MVVGRSRSILSWIRGRRTGFWVGRTSSSTRSCTASKTMSDWEARVLSAPGAAERVAAVEAELTGE